MKRQEKSPEASDRGPWAEEHEEMLVVRCNGAIYARTARSSPEGIGEQIRRCCRWAREHGVHVDDVHVYTDNGVSGNTVIRPGMTALSSTLEAGGVDVVIVTRSSRIGRRMAQVLDFVREEIIGQGKSFVLADSDLEIDKEMMRLVDDSVATTIRQALSNMKGQTHGTSSAQPVAADWATRRHLREVLQQVPTQY